MPYRDATHGKRIDARLMVGGLDAYGDTDIDGAVTCNAAVSPPTVTDAGMVATPGEVGYVVRNLADDHIYVCTVANAVAATWVSSDITGNVAVVGDIETNGDFDAGGAADWQADADVGGDYQTLAGDATVTTNLTVTGDTEITGAVTFDAASEVTGFRPRAVTADPGGATPPTPTVLYEQVVYTADGSLWYCTDATPGAPVWVQWSP